MEYANVVWDPHLCKGLLREKTENGNIWITSTYDQTISVTAPGPATPTGTLGGA